ncbi:MAG: Zn-ribbon domain-containing OB-fold protein [Solirubrobacterales bacterium]|nr:Zn-ribbon domain-containing OB-fold protein [Solirubrobacterales bacterium]
MVGFDPNSAQEAKTTLFPVPQINDDNRAFWTGGRDGELQIVRCGECGYYVHPPSPRCPRCLSENVAPSPVSGRGRVYTYTVNQRAWSPGLEVPYVIAIVQLDEQPDLRLMTNIVGCSADQVSIDMPVQVEFREQGQAFAPVFRPA